MADFFLLQGDGTSKIILGDGSGFLLFDTDAEVTVADSVPLADAVVTSVGINRTFADGPIALSDARLFSETGTTHGRATQIGVEIITRPTSGHARITQTGVEVVGMLSPHARVTQLGVEVIGKLLPKARWTQVGVEVAHRSQYTQTDVRWQEDA